MIRNALVSTLATLALSVLAPSQGPADGSVTLKNGDRLTGKITAITAEAVTIETPATGAVKVALAEVANIATPTPVDLSTASGERVSAPIQGFSDGRLRVGSGAEVRDLPAGDLVGYRPPVEWTGSLSVGGTVSTGNTERRAANAQAQVVRRSDDTRLTLRSSWDYGEQKTRDATTNTFGEWDLAQRRTFGSAKFDYFLSDGLYAFAQVTGENDALADLKLRFTGGAGIGYLIVDETDLMLQGEAGLTYIDENRYTAGADTDYVAARIAYALRWDITAATRFLQDGEFYPSIEDGDDFYCRVDSRLQTSLTGDMFAQLQYVFDYDNTPSPGFERDDHRFIVSIGWGF